jgi:succinate dehydrogenase/fumarate reductase flavoprotein subunit
MSKKNKEKIGGSSGLTRRDFLKGAAVGAAGVAAVSALGACATSPDSGGAAGGVLTGDKVLGGKWNFEVPPAPITNIAETVSADVIVVGAGMAGLCAAVSAAEEGLKTILVSGSSHPTQRGGSNHTTYSRIMEKAGYPRYDVEKIYQAELVAASDRVDNKKWYRFYNNSEEAMNWLLDLLEPEGITAVLEMSNFDDDDDSSPTHMPIASHSFVNDQIQMAGIGQGLAVGALEKQFLALGGTIQYKNIAKQLVRENNNKGRVTAIIAQREDGSYAKYAGAKGIVLATGDFSRDKDMMAKYCSWAMDLIDWEQAKTYDYDFGLQPFDSWGLFHGDGHKMGLWVGAAWQKTTPNAAMIQGSWICSNQPYGGHRGLLINAKGERYSNEDVNAAYGALQQLRQPGKRAFAIWDSAYAQAAAPWYAFGMHHGQAPIPPADVVAGWERDVAGGAFVKGDTLDEVIRKLGLPPAETRATIDRYNALAAKGRDEDFYKKAKHLKPIARGPFYGGEAGTPVFYTVLGGLRTNEYMQVCEEDDTPIPGLYNVGTMVGDMFSNVYNFRLQGHSYGACLTFGYLTGKYIAKNG